MTEKRTEKQQIRAEIRAILEVYRVNHSCRMRQ